MTTKQNNESGKAPLSRRHFLRTSTAALATTAAAGTLSIERMALGALSPGDTLKLALIGCGGRGSGAADQALSTQGPVKLVALADVFEDRLESSLQNLRKRHSDRVDVPATRKFIGFDAYKEAIAEADVVILATPPGFRPIHFEEAVRQGKHIFMEKPVATYAPGVRRMLAANEEAKKKNLKIVVGLQRRYDERYIETIKRLQDGIIGDIVSMRCYWNDAGVWVHPRAELEKAAGRKLTEMEYQLRNWYYFIWLSGDHIVEQHVHNIDVINWVKNAYPVRAQGMGGREVRKGKDFGQIFDHHAVEFEYADGSRCYSYCRHIRGCWNQVAEFVIGTKGEANVGGGSIRDFKGESLFRYRTRRPKNPYQTEHDMLFDAIRNDKPLNNTEYGAKSTMTGIMGRMATYSGRMILWEDALNSNVDTTPEQFSWDALPKILPDRDGNYPVPVPGEYQPV